MISPENRDENAYKLVKVIGIYYSSKNSKIMQINVFDEIDHSFLTK